MRKEETVWLRAQHKPKQRPKDRCWLNMADLWDLWAWRAQERESKKENGKVDRSPTVEGPRWHVE